MKRFYIPLAAATLLLAGAIPPTVQAKTIQVTKDITWNIAWQTNVGINSSGSTDTSCRPNNDGTVRAMCFTIPSTDSLKYKPRIFALERSTDATTKGNVYAIDYTKGMTYPWSSSQNSVNARWRKGSSGEINTCGITSDSNGNIVFITGTHDQGSTSVVQLSSAARNSNLWTTDPSLRSTFLLTRRTINLFDAPYDQDKPSSSTSTTYGRFDYIWATGNTRDDDDANPGFVWFTLADTDRLLRCRVRAESTPTTSDHEEYTLPFTAGPYTMVRPNRDNPEQALIYQANGALGDVYLTTIPQDRSGVAIEKGRELGQLPFCGFVCGTDKDNWLVYVSDKQADGTTTAITSSSTAYTTNCPAIILENLYDGTKITIPASSAAINITYADGTTATGSKAYHNFTSTSWSSRSMYWAGIWLDGYFTYETHPDESDTTTKYPTLKIFAFQPNGGGGKYFNVIINKKSAEQVDAPINFNVTDYTDSNGTKKAKFEWTMPAGYEDATPVIQYFKDGVWYDVDASTDDGGLGWPARSAGATSYTHTSDSYTYRVYLKKDGCYNSDPSNEDSYTKGFTYESTTIEWVQDPLVYSTMGKVQLEWKFTSYSTRPSCYDILRDGVVIASDVLATNYVDMEATQGSHIYQIKGVYYSNESEKILRTADRYYSASSEKTVTLGAYDTAVEQFVCEEIYNYPIDASWNKYIKSFSAQNLYRQGVFNPTEKAWYIYNREDGSIEQSAGISKVNGTVGRIIRINAEAGSKLKTANTAEVVWKTAEGDFNGGVGIAMDEDGNLFVRYKKSTSSWDFSNYGCARGLVLRKKGSGETTDWFTNQTLESSSYAYTTAYAIDLKDMTTLSSNTKLTFADTKDWRTTNSPIYNRSDYFSGKGHWLTSAGGYVYIAEDNTACIYRLKIVNGSPTELKVAPTIDISSGSTEPYAFPLDQYNDMIHGVRSNGFFDVKSNRFLASVDATDSYKYSSAQLWATPSRINNAGGISFYTGSTGKKKLFLVTPQAPKSKNVGDFFVCIAGEYESNGVTMYRPNPSGNADLYPRELIPVLTYEQTDIDRTEVKTEDANGNWFGAVADEDGNGFYLYQYVPGVRIAKYHIHSTTELPSCQIQYIPRIRYTKADGSTTTTRSEGVDIQREEGAVLWNPVTGVCTTSDASYWLRGYKMEYVRTTTGQTISSWMITPDSDHESRVFETPDPYTEFVTPGTSSANIGCLVGTPSGTCLLDTINDVQVLIQPIYQTRYDGTNKSKLIYGAKTFANGVCDFVAKPVANQNVKVYKQWHAKDKYCQDEFWIYRVDVDFDSPAKNYSSASEAEPRSWYTVYYRTSDSDSWKVLPHQMYSKASLRASAAGVASMKSDSETTNIKGTFDFDNDKGKAVDDAQGTSVVYAYVVADGNEYATNVDPSTWQYRIDATYAGNAATTFFGTSITKVRPARATASSPSTTGVENLDTDLHVGTTRYYTLQGIAVKNPQRGQILLEVRGDGSAQMIRY